MKENEYIEHISNLEYKKRAVTKQLAEIDDEIRSVRCKRALFELVENYKKRGETKESHVNILPGHPVWCGINHLFPELPYGEAVYLIVDGVKIKVTQNTLDLYIGTDFEEDRITNLRKLEY